MPETDLNIILRVIDNASDDFRRINQDAIAQVNSLKNAQVDANNTVVSKTNEVKIATSDAYGDMAKSIGIADNSVNKIKSSVVSMGESNDVVYSQMAVAYRKLNDPIETVDKKTKSFAEQLKEASKNARSLRQSLFVATAALAIMIKGLNDAAEYNVESKKTLDAFNNSLKTLSATIGITFAPAIQGLTFLIDGFRQVIEAALAGFVKLFAFIFEYLSQVPAQYKAIFDNIKAIFTGDDPIGIVETFRNSFDRALSVANLAADQILTKIEDTRSRIETGRTLKSDAEQVKTDEKQKEAAIKNRAKVESELKVQAVSDTKEMLQAISAENKAAAVVFKAIQFVESIIATAAAVTKALPNIPLAIAVGAIGAAKSALIASQQFASGTPEVPYDMTAQIHKGETIIPATFAESIRRGDLTLSGGGSTSNSNSVEVNIYYPKMSKADEVKELANMLGVEIERQLQYARGT